MRWKLLSIEDAVVRKVDRSLTSRNVQSLGVGWGEKLDNKEMSEYQIFTHFDKVQ